MPDVLCRSCSGVGGLAPGRRIDALINSSVDFELVNGFFCMRVYDIQDDETQLRCVAPAGVLRFQEAPGMGPVERPFRKHLLMEYHNSPLSGHRLAPDRPRLPSYPRVLRAAPSSL